MFRKNRQFSLRNLRKFENLTYFGLLNSFRFSVKIGEIPRNFHQHLWILDSFLEKMSERLRIKLQKCEKRLTKFGWIFECEAVQRCRSVWIFSFILFSLFCTILFISIHFHYFIFDSVLFSQRRISVNIVDLVKSFREYLLAKFGFDTTENGSLKVCKKLARS